MAPGAATQAADLDEPPIPRSRSRPSLLDPSFEACVAEQLEGLQRRLLTEHARSLAAAAGGSALAHASSHYHSEALQEPKKSYSFLDIDFGESDFLKRLRGPGESAASGADSAGSEPGLPVNSERNGDRALCGPKHRPLVETFQCVTGVSENASIQGESKRPSKESSKQSVLGLPRELRRPPSLDRNGSNISMDSANRYKLLPFWKEQQEEEYHPNVRRRRPNISATISGSTLDTFRNTGDFDDDDETWLEYHAHRKCCMKAIHPNSKMRLTWDMMGMFLLAWDVVWTPLQTFEPDATAFTDFMDWAHLVFWSIDLPASFFTAFFTHGRLVKNLVKIAKVYVRSWFLLDVLLVTVDWIIVALDGLESEQSALGLFRVGKVVRVVRMMRVVRLLRLLKLRRYWIHVEERIQSRHVLVTLGIIKVLMLILVINHVVACLWWLAGNHDPGPGYTTWISAHETVKDITKEGLPYKYTTSLHWSITQFTPAAMEVYATNPVERIVSVVVIVFALITFSSFVSSITKAMQDLSSLNNQHGEQLLMFQRFLRSRKISTELSVRMRRHLEHRLVGGKTRIEERDVELLKLLSKPLLMELHMEIYTGYLECHPFFEKFSEFNLMGIRKLCHTAVEELAVSRHDILFSVGDTTSKVYFVQSGMLSYSPNCIPIAENVHPCGDMQGWLCEACLWTEWMCVGDAEGEERSHLLSVDSALFHEVVKSCKGQMLQPVRYAKIFVEYLNSLEEELLTDLPLRHTAREAFMSPSHSSPAKRMFASPSQDSSPTRFDEARAVEQALFEKENESPL